MQGQPDLLALGGSRLELFKTFCLPTMVSQTTSDFLWIILVDPILHPSMMDELKQLVAPYPHFYIMRKIAMEIDLKSLDLSLVESGDKGLLEQASRAADSKILVQTRLDADDGLANVLLETMQNNAVNVLQFWNASKDENGEGWMIQCAEHHVEWHYNLLQNDTKDDSGWLLMVDTPWFCVTPGLTVATARNMGEWTNRTNYRSPLAPHDKIHKRYPKCQNRIKTGCVHMMNELNRTVPAAVRSRTPASSFMRGVGTTEKEEETPEEYWEYLEDTFTIHRKSLATTRNFLLENAHQTAKENLESQWYAAVCAGLVLVPFSPLYCTCILTFLSVATYFYPVPE